MQTITTILCWSNILKMSNEIKVEEQPYSIYDEVFKDLEALNND